MTCLSWSRPGAADPASFAVLGAKQGLGPGAAVALLLLVVSSTSAAAPISMVARTTETNVWTGASSLEVPDPCAQRVSGCHPGRFDAFDTSQLPPGFARFSAQLDEAFGSTAGTTELQRVDAAAWVLYSDAIRSADATLASASTAQDATSRPRLLDGVAGLVQEIPEPPLLVSVVIGVLSWRRRSLSRTRRPRRQLP